MCVIEKLKDAGMAHRAFPQKSLFMGEFKKKLLGKYQTITFVSAKRLLC